MTSRTPNPTGSGQDELWRFVAEALFTLKDEIEENHSNLSTEVTPYINSIMNAVSHHTKEAVEAARIDENRLSQRCFDGMTGAPGDQFSKHFARLTERGFELSAPQQSTSPDGEKKDGDE